MPNKKNRKKQSYAVKLIHHAINVIVPRSHNNYRPHLISGIGLGAIALLAGAGLWLAASSQQTAVLGAQPEITPAALLKDVNAERTRAGGAELAYSAVLADAALAKGKDMLANQYWAHTSPSGVTPWKWIQDQQYSYMYAGENLAKNFSSADATVAAWMASSAHRENMMHDYYTEAGFAVVDGQLDDVPTTIIVALFATPASTTVAGASTSSPQTGADINFLSRVGLSVQAMNPMLLGSVLLALLAIAVAALTFASTHVGVFRMWQKKPLNKVRQTTAWHQHHTVGKAVGLASFVIIAVALFSGGQL